MASAPTGNPLSTAPADQSPLVNPITGRATPHFKQWMRGVKRVLQPGISLTGAQAIVIPKLTSGGTNGSITVVNGIVTGYTAPT
jgi:hypothetical protein